MLRTAILWCALVLATMTLGQSDFDFGYPSTGRPPQLPLGSDYEHACRELVSHLSPASRVSYPG